MTDGETGPDDGCELGISQDEKNRKDGIENKVHGHSDKDNPKRTSIDEMFKPLDDAISKLSKSIDELENNPVYKGEPVAKVLNKVFDEHGLYVTIEPIMENNNGDDPVNHPSHYTDGGIETIDFIEAKQLPYHLGNAVKYISRSGKKDDAIQDLKKAQWYLDRYIKQLEK